MTSNYVAVHATFPLSVVKSVDKLAKAKQFPSRASIILRACEEYIRTYRWEVEE